MKLVKDVKQTLHALGILSVMRFTVLKIAVINAQKPGYPCWMSNESTWFKDKCKPFYSCFGNCQRLVYKISAYEVCIICPKLISACKIHCKSQSTAQWSHYARLVHGPWSDPFGLHKGIGICAEPCGMWKSTSDSAFAYPANISEMQKRCK